MKHSQSWNKEGRRFRYKSEFQPNHSAKKKSLRSADWWMRMSTMVEMEICDKNWQSCTYSVWGWDTHNLEMRKEDDSNPNWSFNTINLLWAFHDCTRTWVRDVQKSQIDTLILKILKNLTTWACRLFDVIWRICRLARELSSYIQYYYVLQVIVNKRVQSEVRLQSTDIRARKRRSFPDTYCRSAAIIALESMVGFLPLPSLVHSFFWCFSWIGHFNII